MAAGLVLHPHVATELRGAVVGAGGLHQGQRLPVGYARCGLRTAGRPRLRPTQRRAPTLTCAPPPAPSRHLPLDPGALPAPASSSSTRQPTRCTSAQRRHPQTPQASTRTASSGASRWARAARCRSTRHSPPTTCRSSCRWNAPQVGQARAAVWRGGAAVVLRVLGGEWAGAARLCGWKEA